MCYFKSAGNMSKKFTQLSEVTVADYWALMDATAGKSGTEQALEIMAWYSSMTIAQIESLPLEQGKQLLAAAVSIFEHINNGEFKAPGTFEFEGRKYHLEDPRKMTFGLYMDLEQTQNIPDRREVMMRTLALMLRPDTETEYNGTERLELLPKLGKLPIEIAMYAWQDFTEPLSGFMAALRAYIHRSRANLKK